MNFLPSIQSFFGSSQPQPPEGAKTIESLNFPPDKADWLRELGYTFDDVNTRIEQGFTPEEIINAVTVKLLHDKVEIAAYAALQKGIEQLQLLEKEGVTEITEEQSIFLLHKCVKPAAHAVMRGKDGYIHERSKYLKEKQMQPIFSNVTFIVTDRDSKLTNAAYTSLEDLINALDEHNSAVNAILFDAWGVPPHHQHHLTLIKNEAGYTGSKKIAL